MTDLSHTRSLDYPWARRVAWRWEHDLVDIRGSDLEDQQRRLCFRNPPVRGGWPRVESVPRQSSSETRPQVPSTDCNAGFASTEQPSP